jgi:2-oxoisovalerate dehydrogenase E1 component
MTRAAIADPDPCILIECRALYQDVARVAKDAPPEEAAHARLRKTGDDVAIVSWGRMANRALEAAAVLAEEGVNAAVLDLRWLSPLDRDAIDEVARLSGRILVVHEANVTGGFGAEVVASIVERSFDYLDAPVARLGTPDVRIPAAPVLQHVLVPGVGNIVSSARELTRR